jgi:hypothetical protein
MDATIGAGGPIVNIRLWIGPAYADGLIAAGVGVPPPVSFPGLVGTGAERTAIQRSVADWTGSPMHSFLRLKSSVLGREEREAPVYQFRMTFGSLESPDPPK